MTTFGASVRRVDDTGTLFFSKTGIFLVTVAVALGAIILRMVVASKLNLVLDTVATLVGAVFGKLAVTHSDEFESLLRRIKGLVIASVVAVAGWWLNTKLPSLFRNRINFFGDGFFCVCNVGSFPVIV